MSLGPVTSLHFAANGNFATGAYAPAADGFNLADVSSPSELSLLPTGVQGLVYLGMTSGVTSAFISAVDAYLGKPNVFGFYIADEPNPSVVSAANLKAESDYIHAHFPGAKTFIVEYNQTSDTSPTYAFTPANTDIDLFGLDPYPVNTNVPNKLDYQVIPAAVNEALNIGIPLHDIVPVYQTFGGGQYSTYVLPTPAQEQQILATWASVVPNPVFDYAYSWGLQASDTALSSDPSLAAVLAAHNVSVSVACYLEGTRLLTDRGEIDISSLRIGDLIVTTSGTLRPIVWIGWRELDCTRHPDPRTVWPVRVSAHAFGTNVPRRDLWLSPGHNIACEGVLVPISALLNGKSVEQIRQEHVKYWHVELDAHDVMLAEGLPAESYLDTGNRTAFSNGGPFVEAHPDFAPRHWADTCLPLVLKGDAVAAARTRLLARLLEQGCELTQDADAHVWVDGLRVEPMWLSATRLAFALPPDGREIALRSRTFIPARTNADSDDSRALGLCIAALQIDGSFVGLTEDQALSSGWHDAEYQREKFTHRWTAGEALLPAGTRVVIVDLAGVGYYWRDTQEKAIALLA